MHHHRAFHTGRDPLGSPSPPPCSSQDCLLLNHDWECCPDTPWTLALLWANNPSSEDCRSKKSCQGFPYTVISPSKDGEKKKKKWSSSSGKLYLTRNFYFWEPEKVDNAPLRNVWKQWKVSNTEHTLTQPLSVLGVWISPHYMFVQTWRNHNF